jgi:hypothetical protein
MAIDRVPAALLPSDWVTQTFITPVQTQTFGTSLTWDQCAPRLWGYRHRTGIYFGTGSLAQFVVIINQRPAPISLAIDDTSAFHGDVTAMPTIMGWDDNHGHQVEIGPVNTIPAADRANGLVGVGITGSIQTSAFYGTAMGFEITLSDLPNEDKIWFACQNAIGHWTDPQGRSLRQSVALTDDHAKYGSLSAFYDQAADDERLLDTTLTLLPGKGRDKTATFTARASTAFLGVRPPDWAGGIGQCYVQQIALVIS